MPTDALKYQYLLDQTVKTTQYRLGVVFDEMTRWTATERYCQLLLVDLPSSGIYLIELKRIESPNLIPSHEKSLCVQLDPIDWCGMADDDKATALKPSNRGIHIHLHRG